LVAQPVESELAFSSVKLRGPMNPQYGGKKRSILLRASTPSVTIRAVQILEYIGTTQAREVLEALAKGAAEARLTQEAKGSLDRLTRK
jgi:hypothetical protein